MPAPSSSNFSFDTPDSNDRGRKGPRGPGGGGGPGGGRGGARDGRGGGDRGRGGKGGGKGGRGGGRKDRNDGVGSASFRIKTELSTLEKALTKVDFAEQKGPLEEILKALKPLKLTSVDALGFEAKGRFITTLMRVSRQPAPAPAVSASPAEAAPEVAPAPAAEPAPAEGAETQAAPPASEAPAADAASPAPEAAAAPPASAAPPAKDERRMAYEDVHFLLGLIWRAVKDEHRAALAFAASGRISAAEEAVETLHRAGDWAAEAALLEQQGKSRNAARLHENHQGYADAARLYLAAKDFKGALRAGLKGKIEATVEVAARALRPAEAVQVFEQEKAFEPLMNYYVAKSDFVGIAKLYERAGQHGEAAQAWERAGKLAAARKAFAHAGDAENAQRLAQAEVVEFTKRGDRLSAAQVLLAAGDKAGAVALLKALPANKAFGFLQKLKLDEEALALARESLDEAKAAGKPANEAAWFELMGDSVAAGEAWLRASRRDRALPLFEQAGDWKRAAELAEALGQYPKAIELFHRAGDRANAERVQALPPRPRAAVAPAAPASPETP